MNDLPPELIRCRLWPVSSARVALFGWLGLGMAVGLSSCAVGPDFETPAPPQDERFTKERSASPGNGQRFREGAEVSCRWWMEFRSPRLNGLIEEALQRNTTIESAMAAMALLITTQRRASALSSPRSCSIPIRATISIRRMRPTPPSRKRPSRYYNKSVQISYALDVWGGARRNIEFA